MQYEIIDSPDFGFVRIQFESAGEHVKTETQAMVAKDSSVEMKTNMQGGLLAAAKRKMLGGESLFQNTFTAASPGQRLILAPAPEGDMRAWELDGTDGLFLSSGAWVGSGPDVSLDTKWGGAKGFFSGTGMFLLNCQGKGPVFFASYGAIHEVDVAGGYVVDTSHIVGFTSGLQYNVKRVGGLKSLLLSGEGLVCEFHGTGKLWISTRSAERLAAFLHPFRPQKKSN